MQSVHEIEHKTGTPNPVYDIISVMYHALQGVEAYDRYIADAEQRGDDELADFDPAVHVPCTTTGRSPAVERLI